MVDFNRKLMELRGTDSKAEDDKWITAGGGEGKKGRKILLDDEGNIKGGSVPKSMQGTNMKDYHENITSKGKSAHRSKSKRPAPGVNPKAVKARKEAEARGKAKPTVESTKKGSELKEKTEKLKQGKVHTEESIHNMAEVEKQKHKEKISSGKPLSQRSSLAQGNWKNEFSRWDEPQAPNKDFLWGYKDYLEKGGEPVSPEVRRQERRKEGHYNIYNNRKPTYKADIAKMLNEPNASPELATEWGLRGATPKKVNNMEELKRGSKLDSGGTTKITGVDYSNKDFRPLNNEVSLRDVNSPKSNFEGMTIEGISSSNLRGANLKDIKFFGGSWHWYDTDVTGADFTGAVMLESGYKALKQQEGFKKAIGTDKIRVISIEEWKENYSK